MRTSRLKSTLLLAGAVALGVTIGAHLGHRNGAALNETDAPAALPAGTDVGRDAPRAPSSGSPLLAAIESEPPGTGDDRSPPHDAAPGTQTAPFAPPGVTEVTVDAAVPTHLGPEDVDIDPGTGLATLKRYPANGAADAPSAEYYFPSDLAREDVEIAPGTGAVRLKRVPQ